MKYEALYNYTIEHGGATIRLKDYPEMLVMPTKGYAVGEGAIGYVVPFDGADPETFDVTIERALAWFAEHGGIEFLGTWIDDGVLYVDPVHVFTRKDFALGVAWAWGERAVYDFEAGKSINIQRRK